MKTSSDTGTPTAGALGLLPLPDLATLSEPQVRGRACVWCAIILDATAIDLGPRPLKRLDVAAQWFPRSCHPCTVAKTDKALVAHLNLCRPCNMRGGSCAVGDELRAAVKHGPR